jgi:hypothetical protein
MNALRLREILARSHASNVQPPSAIAAWESSTVVAGTSA